MRQEPVIVRINRFRACFGAFVLIAAGLPFAFVPALALVAQQFHWMVLLFGLFAAGFVGTGVYLAGLILGNPVALRMDETGISGYFAPPTRWQEIKEIKEIRQTSYDRARFIGFAMHDAASFRERLSPHQKRKVWSNWKNMNVHIAVPTYLLTAADIPMLIEQAKTRHAQANTRP